MSDVWEPDGSEEMAEFGDDDGENDAFDAEDELLAELDAAGFSDPEMFR